MEILSHLRNMKHTKGYLLRSHKSCQVCKFHLPNQLTLFYTHNAKWVLNSGFYHSARWCKTSRICVMLWRHLWRCRIFIFADWVCAKRLFWFLHSAILFIKHLIYGLLLYFSKLGCLFWPFELDHISLLSIWTVTK